MRPCNASTTYFVMQWNFTNQDLEGIRIFCRHYTESTFCCCYTYTKLGMKTDTPFLFIMFEIKYIKTLFRKTIEIRKTFRDRDSYIQNEYIDFCLQIDCYFFLLLFPVYYYTYI